jgi:hypothetical protein
VISPKQQSQTIVEMKKPVADNKSKDVSVFEKMVPEGFDLVKNLENNIQQFKKIAASSDFKDKTKKIELAFSKAGSNLDAQVKPHIKQIEATELQIEDLLKQQYLNGQNTIQLNEWQLKELGNADWAKIFTPALEESLKVLALPRIVGEGNWKIAETPETPPVVADKLKAEISGASPLSKEQLRQVNRLQAKINREQAHLLQMTEMQHTFADSMQFTFAAPNTPPLAYYNEAFSRARKQAAIAPFRQREKNNPGYYKPAEPNHNYYTYSYNDVNENDNGNEDDASHVYMQTDDEVNSDRKMKQKEDCTSPESKKPGTKRVVVFNGKEFSAKVKQVWAEAQQQIPQQEWTEEMQQKVAKEIERELKQFDHVEIKTHISTRPDSNKKTILIEVETTSDDN